MSIIVSESGYIVIDPLVSAETARASLDLARRHLGERPVVAVIYTHSHVDHWGGVRGVLDEADVAADKAKVIAPVGFTEAAVAENVDAGNTMSRRASCMYGNLVPKDARGAVGAGLGQTTSSGRVTLIPPTDIIDTTGTELDIDGVRLVFQNTPGTEAPAEFNFFFPQLKALCMAENCTHKLHNLYTLRGAKVRDAKAWAHFLGETVDLFADETEVIFASHHWPTWGKERCLDLLQRQRDMYKYLHDETLRLANHGYTMLEIPEALELPPQLARAWYNRGYYGTVSHDVKAIYQLYLGFFDGNPAHLHALPPEEAAKKYVECMGGADALLERARRSFDEGDYRWVSEVVSHAVFADPSNQEARLLEADALEQLGYQAESSPWRNFYLTGAMELRRRVEPGAAPNTASDDVIAALTPAMLFDTLGVRLNGPKAAGKQLTISVRFSDLGEDYVLAVGNGVLNHFAGRRADDGDASLTLTRAALNEALAHGTSVDELVRQSRVEIEGSAAALQELLSLLDSFEFWFNIVEP